MMRLELLVPVSRLFPYGILWEGGFGWRRSICFADICSGLLIVHWGRLAA